MKKSTNKILLKNTIMMYILSISKLIIPLISLPYLTRVLSINCYGSVSFVKSIISYMQILIDFGFLLSGTKDIISTISNKETTNKKIGNILYSQLILCFFSIIIMIIICNCFKIVEGFQIYSLLSLIPVILSIFLFEYLFKAYEKMDKIAIRYVIMKLISLILTILFVKSDADILLIPIFDIIASLIAVFMVFMQIKKLGLKCEFSIKNLKDALKSLKESFIYFISSLATTAFSALNTLIIGLLLSKETVAYWSVAMQLVSAIQALYSPIINSVFPSMVKNKNLQLIHKIMAIYMPLIIIGCIIILILGDWVVALIFGENYIMSSIILKYLIPILIFSFPAMLYGWPCLGAIDKQKETSITTIISSVIQIVGILFLIIINQFNLISLCIVRCITELVLCLMRMIIVYKNKKLFITPTNESVVV